MPKGEKEPMPRCVIVSGAGISDYARINAYLRPDDFFIFCDGGLRHLRGLRAAPDLAVGDFDSHEKPEGGIETLVLPREKDDTDTVYAAREAVRRGFDDFLLLGAAGGRIDHTLGNLGLLLWLEEQGRRALLADDYSDMQIVSREKVFITEEAAYFSLLNISGTARGITVTGAKYPLEEGEIRCDYQYGISNEVLPGETAAVSVREGRLLLVRVYADPQAGENAAGQG